MCHFGDVQIGGCSSWGMCQLRDLTISDFLGTILILKLYFNHKNLNLIISWYFSHSLDVTFFPNILNKNYQIFLTRADKEVIGKSGP